MKFSELLNCMNGVRGSTYRPYRNLQGNCAITFIIFNQFFLNYYEQELLSQLLLILCFLVSVSIRFSVLIWIPLFHFLTLCLFLVID